MPRTSTQYSEALSCTAVMVLSVTSVMAVICVGVAVHSSVHFWSLSQELPVLRKYYQLVDCRIDGWAEDYALVAVGAETGFKAGYVQDRDGLPQEVEAIVNGTTKPEQSPNPDEAWICLEQQNGAPPADEDYPYYLAPRDYKSLRDSAIIATIILVLGVLMAMSVAMWSSVVITRHKRYMAFMESANRSGLRSSALRDLDEERGVRHSTRIFPAVPAVAARSVSMRAIHQLLDGGRVEAEPGEDAGCVICLDDFDQKVVDQERVRVALPCKHQFHHHCIVQWLQRGNGRCPVCLADPWSKPL